MTHDVVGGDGILVTEDEVALAANYVDGSAYDDRFVNVGEDNSNL